MVAVGARLFARAGCIYLNVYKLGFTIMNGEDPAIVNSTSEICVPFHINWTLHDPGIPAGG